jgi:HEAT repeat protein
MTGHQDETGTRAGGQTEAPSDDVRFGRTLIQFFVIPAVVVASCVGVFFFFAWLVSNEKTGVDYLQEVRVGSANRRWQAAFELSKLITMDSERTRMEGLVPEMITAFEDAADDDPRVRHYLALSLGHLGDDAASPVLIEALSDADSTTRLYASWALGSIGERRAVEPLISLVGDDDAGVRKMAVYALGAIGDDRAVTRLEAALDDPQRDVSWNAAVSLAKLGSPAGEALLLQMLDRQFLDKVDDMNEAQKLLAMESAIRAASLLKSPALSERVRSIGDSDPNLSLRRVAKEALAAPEKSQKLVEP